MKKTLLLILIIITLSLSAQDFAPLGAKWHYTVKWAFSYQNEERFMTIDATKDTLINSINCRKIETSQTFCGRYRSSFCYVYSNDSVVYFYDITIKKFQTLYNFKAKKNESWKIVFPTYNNIDSNLVKVDSTSYVEINSNTLKVLYVKYVSISDSNKYINSKIIQRIGDIEYLFSFYDFGYMCDSDYPGGLRCYEDDDFGFYSTGIANSCEYRYIVGINESIKDAKDVSIKISPNPVNSLLDVSYSLLVNKEAKVSVYDITGRKVKSQKSKIKSETNKQTLTVDISELNEGIYFVNVSTEGFTKTEKFVVAR